MVTPAEFKLSATAISNQALDVLEVIGSREPPSWTRLEPQNLSGDPGQALEARVHDPLWLLTRQWQLGEFEGEDAGSPVSVHVEATSSRLTRWLPGDGAASVEPVAGLPFRRGDLLEPLIEAEPPALWTAATDLQRAAEAGMRLVRDLRAARLADEVQAFASAYPLAAAPRWAAEDPQVRRLARFLPGRCPDGHLVARALAHASAGSLPAPLRVTPARAAAVLAVATAWLAWYRAEHDSSRAFDAEVANAAPDDCWVPERLEYRFRMAAPGPDRERVVVAPEFLGGRVDWWAFDERPGASLGAANDEPARRIAQTLLPAPVRFAGMPADRFWEFEDARVNLGKLDAHPHDLARLLLVEFATVYGNDWVVVPLDVAHGTLTTVESVSYSTTFGDRFAVSPADALQGDRQRWQMFRLSGETPGAPPALLVPPASPGYLVGPALEEVLLLRDEMANLAWAVERVVEGPAGRALDRSREGLPVLAPRPDPRLHEHAELDYLLETNVPARWIPLVPVRTSGRAFRLVRGALTAVADDGTRRPIEPRSRLLSDSERGRFWVHEEEVPRAGARLLRSPSAARLANGSMVSWVGRQVRVGRGEGTSGLAFDSALPRPPR
jgi:hypothetical protein